MSKFNYKAGKDYQRLKELLDKGYEVIVIVRHPFINVTTALKGMGTHPYRIHLLTFANAENFLDACEEKEIEFIEPNGEE